MANPSCHLLSRGGYLTPQNKALDNPETDFLWLLYTEEIMDYESELLQTMSEEDMAALFPIIRVAFPSLGQTVSPPSRHSITDRCKLRCSEDMKGVLTGEHDNPILSYLESNVDGFQGLGKNVAGSTISLYHQYYSDEHFLKSTPDSNMCEDMQQQSDYLKEFRNLDDVGCVPSSFLTPRTSTCKTGHQHHISLQEELRNLTLLSGELGQSNSNGDSYLIRPLEDQFSFLNPSTSHFQNSQYMDEPNKCCSDDCNFEGDDDIDHYNDNGDGEGGGDEYYVSYDHLNDPDWHDDEPYYCSTSSVDYNLYFPKISRRKRKVVKTSVGWVKNTLSSLLFGSRVRHKRKCSLPCCMGRETEVMKKRRVSSSATSAYGSKICDKNDSKFGLNLTVEEMPKNKSTNGSKCMQTHKPDEEKQSLANCTPMNMRREAPGSGGGYASSYMTAAVIAILLDAGSQGVTGKETTRRLMKQGFSKAILGLNAQSEVVDEVKRALKECPAIRELKNHRFILRDPRLYVNAKRVDESNMSIKNHRYNTGIYLGEEEYQCQELSHNSAVCSSTGLMQYSDGYAVKKPNSGDINNRRSAKEDSDMARVGSCSEKSTEQDAEEVALSRCCRTDGKHWQCANQAMAGSVYCRHHHHQRRRKKSIVK